MHNAEKIALDNAIKEIVNNPFVGELKVGDLAGIQVFKYRHKTQLYLLAYEFIEKRLILTFIEHGTHENFYRNLKQ
jgi:hypothetical protein